MKKNINAITQNLDNKERSIMRKKICLLLIITMGILPSLFAQKQVSLESPNGSIKVKIEISNKLYYTISADGDILFEKNNLQLNLNGSNLGENPKLTKISKRSINKELRPIVPLKYSIVKDHYNEVKLDFKGNYSVEFRAYDEGISYRFLTKFGKEIEILDEEFNINFPQDYKLHLQEAGGFKTAYEEPYSHKLASEWKNNDKMSTLPIVIDATSHKILISETDLYDYPAMFLKGTGKGLSSVFPKEPLEFGEDGDRSLKLLKEADYIAKTKGIRSYPWRYYVIAKEDGALLTNTMSYKLSTKNKIEDTSWIKPGQVSWEWWNDASPYGPDVNFVAGYNLETYKYYIDFAAKYGIPYIIMDEGWAKTTLDPYTPNPKVDVHELIRYGKEKNVGIVLWLTWLTVEKNMELFQTFADWGVKGVKIDFMDRSDQWMMNYYERVAAKAAEHKLFVDFHGSITPKGLEYKYPNVLSYEGVRGQEQMGGCKPENTIYLPFMRNAVGAMDFTPGAMINMQPNVYCSQRPNSASMGTRAYNLAMFVIFESGLQMLCDNPTQYYQNQDCTEFITGVPVTWDETKILEAKLGEFVIVAKRKGQKWFIGGMNDEKVKDLTINLNFLDPNRTYNMTYFEDGINAHRQAMDYRKKQTNVTSGSSFQISMVRNGGWAAVIE